MAVGPARRLAPRLVGLLPIALPRLARRNTVDRSRSGDRCCARSIEHHQRLAAIAGLLDRLPQDAPVGADRLIGLAEMLLGAILDRAHRLAGPLVMHVDVGAHAGERVVLLLVRIEAVVVALVLARD